MVRKNWFIPLKMEDIEEKIEVNLKKMSIHQFRDALYKELFVLERMNFKIENMLLTNKLQTQNLKEQIKVVEDKIREG